MSNWIPQGCWSNDTKLPTLTGLVVANLAQGDCQSKAEQNGYDLISEQEGMCFMGFSAKDRYKTIWSKTGGPGIQCVYANRPNGVDVSTAVDGWQDQGQWLEPNNGQIMTDFLGNLTLVDCAKKATDMSYNTIGLRNGDPANGIVPECWAANSVDYKSQGPSTVGVSGAGDYPNSYVNSIYTRVGPAPTASYWTDQGCWFDQDQFSDFLGLMKKEQCIAAAEAGGFNTLGLIYGVPDMVSQESWWKPKCYAGVNTDYQKGGIFTPSKYDPVCTSGLGTTGAFSVFTRPTPSVKWNLKGCFKEGTPPVLPTKLGTLDLEACKAKASLLGYNTVGMQAGDPITKMGDCWAGTDSQYDTYGDSTECTDFLGANLVNLVYSSKPDLQVVASSAPGPAVLVVQSAEATVQPTVPVASATVPVAQPTAPVAQPTVPVAYIDQPTIPVAPIDQSASSADSTKQSNFENFQILVLILLFVIITAMCINLWKFSKFPPIDIV
jgi:hypothetical protein